MFRRCTFLAWLGCLTLLPVQAGWGDPPTGSSTAIPRVEGAARTDRYGDLLPVGVRARLGTERLILPHAVFLTFSPDGHRLAAHNGQEWLCVWDADSGKVLLRLRTPGFDGYGTGMNPLVFSPDSKAIALACPSERGLRNSSASVRIWDVASGKEIHRADGFQGIPRYLAFSSDGRYLFGGGYQVPVVRWDLARDMARKKYESFSLVTSLAISRDGKTLTASTIDQKDGYKRVFVRWDAATGKEMGRKALPPGGRWSGMLSPEGDLLAAPPQDGKSIALLDPLTGQERRQLRGSDYPSLIAFSPDGKAVTCSTKDGFLRVWDTATGKLRTRFKVPYTEVIWLALSPDGKRLALTSKVDDAVHLWDVATGRELHTYHGHRGGNLSLAFLKNGKEIATASRDWIHSTPISTWEDWSMRRWDAATGDELAVTRANPNGEVYFTVFSADGRRLATVIHDGTLQMWDVESGKALRSWKVPIRETKLISRDAKGTQKVTKAPHPRIMEPVFSPDGKILFAAADNKIHRWETATGKELPILEVKDLAEQMYAWCLPSPDGRTLAVWSIGGRRAPVLLLDAESGKVRQRLPILRTRLRPPAFSPDGRSIAFTEFDKVSLWEVASGQPRGQLPVSGRTHALAFEPDGRFLAVGAAEAPAVSLWDLATGRVVGRLSEDGGSMQVFSFSPDGSCLAVVGSFSTVLVCDVAELCGHKSLEESARAATPAEAELPELWAELSGANSARAYRAIRRLGMSGARGAVFLKARLKNDKGPDEKRIDRLIADLDHDEFTIREKASAELEKLGIHAEPALRRTLQGKPSPEARARVKRLLDRLQASGEAPSAELVRRRVVEALEANGSKEARQALTELADGPPDAVLTQEAQASLARMRSRPSRR